MVITDAKGYSWSRTGTRHSKRTVVVNTGCYVIEHIATGKVLTGVGKQISDVIDKVLLSFEGTSPANKAFGKLCHLDPDVRIYEFPTKNIKEAKQVEHQLHTNLGTDYLLLNK